MNVFSVEYFVGFGDADPAGIMFYAKINDFYHRAYEEWVIENIGSWGDWFESPSFAVPIRAIKVDYLSPVFAGKPIKVELAMDEASIHSFQLKATFYQGDKTCSEMSVRHVFISKKDHKIMEIPKKIKEILFR